MEFTARIWKINNSYVLTVDKNIFRLLDLKVNDLVKVDINKLSKEKDDQSNINIKTN